MRWMKQQMEEMRLIEQTVREAMNRSRLYHCGAVHAKTPSTKKHGLTNGGWFASSGTVSSRPKDWSSVRVWFAYE